VESGFFPLLPALQKRSGHYYRNDFAQHCTFALRGGLLFVSAAVNPTIYRGGHFLFTVADTFARHGKSIFRSGHLKMPATENTYFPRRAS